MSVSRTTLRDIRDALAQLDKERESLSAQIAEIDRRAEALRLAHDYLTRLHEEAQAETINSAPVKNLRNEMVQILRDAGKPLHYTELRNQLETRGLTINGVDKAKTVGAHLSNDTRFKKLGKGMWALASWAASVSQLDNDDELEHDTDEDSPAHEPEEPSDLALSEREWDSLIEMQPPEESDQCEPDIDLSEVDFGDPDRLIA